MHRIAILVSALQLACGGALANPAEPPRAFPVDPVELVRGAETPGDPSLSVDHAGYRYTFASAENKTAFERDPAKFEIQLGGACARMGALGGACSAEHYAVHDGRVFVFASKQCRATFLKDPSRVLEGPDPIPDSTPDTLATGTDLVSLAVRGFGGPAALDGVRTITYSSERTEGSGGEAYLVRSSFFGAFPDRFRVQTSWKDSLSGHVLTGGDAFAVTSRGGVSPLASSQRDALEREVLRRTLVLLKRRAERGFVAVGLAPGVDEAAPGSALVAVAFRGATTILTVEHETGRILAAQRRARGPDGFLTMATHTFDDFRPVGALVLPHRVTTTYASGSPDEARSQDLTIRVNEPLDDALFERDGVNQ